MLNLTPEEALSGYRPSVAHMNFLGDTAYAHVPKEKRRKIDDKSVKFVFIGYIIETISCKLFDPQAKKVIISKDVVFDEHGIYQSKHVWFELRKGVVDISGVKKVIPLDNVPHQGRPILALRRI